MAVSYKKLFKLLIDRNMKKKDFRKLTGLSYATIAKLENGDNVMSSILENICLKLDCSIGDMTQK